MSFVQEFTEQQLSKNISHQMLQQVQSCHSAVEQLICNLQGLRSAPRLPIIDLKIERIQSYLVVKKEIVGILQNNNHNAIVKWLREHQINSPLLIALLDKQTQAVKEMIQNAIKRVFLKSQNLNEFVGQNEIITSCLSELKQLRQSIKNSRQINRQKVRNIDQGCSQVQQRLQQFISKVCEFNNEILSIVNELKDFEVNISSQFRNIIAHR